VDIETSEAIERIGERIDALDVSLRDEIRVGDGSLREEIRAVDASLRGQIRALDASLRGEIRALDASLRGEIATVRDAVRTEFRDGLAESRRHTQVLFESVRDDIRMVAEGVAALAAKIDTPRA
jgi:hypothetical protein